MTLVAYLDGSDEAHRIKIGEMGLSSRADGGGAFGQIIFDDPDGTLDVRGFMHVRVEETDCTTAPILHWGWIWVRTYKRGPYKDGPGRIIDCQVLDPNYALNHGLITGLDGKRDSESDLERTDWVLGSAYIPSFLQDFGLVDRSAPHPMEEANYLGQYPAEVMQDLTGQLWKTWFAYVDQDEEALGLFYDTPPSTASTSTLTISNVLSDGSSTCYYPFLDAEMERDPSEVYSKMRFKYRNGVVLGQNDDTYDEFFADTGLGHRGIQVESTRVGLESTARARIVTLLERASQEADTITCSIWIEPASVGLIQAGQRLGVRFTHLPGYGTLAYSRVTARTVRQIRADLYQIDLELNVAGVTAGAGGGGGGEFPHQPPCTSSPVPVRFASYAGSAISFATPPPAGSLLTAHLVHRNTPGIAAPVNGGTWTTIAVVDQLNTGNIGAPDQGGVYWRLGDGVTNLWTTPTSNMQMAIVEWPVGATLDSATASLSAQSTLDFHSGGAITPTGSPATLVGFGMTDAGDGVDLVTPEAGTTTISNAATNVSFHPGMFVGYQTDVTGSASVDGTMHSTNGWAGVSYAVLCGGVGDPPDSGQWIYGEVLSMSGAVGTTVWPYADGSVILRVDGVLISRASYTETDGAAGTITLSWTPDTDEVVTCDYQGR